MSNPAPASPFHSARALVFDSGVGGLSIATEIQRRLPNLGLLYASDNAAFPYGTKSEAELIERVDLVVSRLIDVYQPDLLVIACNTASTLTLPHLRSKFSLPIVGVVPAIKPAAEQTRSGVIGLLATPATVARPYTQELIRTYAAHCQVISLGSRELVELAEQKLRGQPIAAEAVAAITRQLIATPVGARMDYLVLACTHFPLLRTEIAASLPTQISLIDSGAAIARRLEYLLQVSPAQTSPACTAPTPAKATDLSRAVNIALFTEQTRATEQLRTALHSFGIDQLAYLNLPFSPH